MRNYVFLAISSILLASTNLQAGMQDKKDDIKDYSYCNLKQNVYLNSFKRLDTYYEKIKVDNNEFLTLKKGINIGHIGLLYKSIPTRKKILNDLFASIRQSILTETTEKDKVIKDFNVEFSSSIKNIKILVDQDVEVLKRPNQNFMNDLPKKITDDLLFLYDLAQMGIKTNEIFLSFNRKKYQLNTEMDKENSEYNEKLKESNDVISKYVNGSLNNPNVKNFKTQENEQIHYNLIKQKEQFTKEHSNKTNNIEKQKQELGKTIEEMFKDYGQWSLFWGGSREKQVNWWKEFDDIIDSDIQKTARKLFYSKLYESLGEKLNDDLIQFLDFSPLLVKEVKEQFLQIKREIKPVVEKETLVNKNQIQKMEEKKDISESDTKSNKVKIEEKQVDTIPPQIATEKKQVNTKETASQIEKKNSNGN